MRVFYLFILLIWISPNVKGQLDSHSDYNKLHCVSIGVSDYKNIRSLNFAHNDAISFAEFVSKNQLWPKDKNIILLTDANATAGKIYASLNKCMKDLDSNNLFVFYFAGHADTESIEDGAESFLMAHDSEKNAYHQGGTLSAKNLEKYIQQVVAKNANAIVVIDACRSGNYDLVGSLQGIEFTHKNFRKMSQSEIRILSSQHNQKSEETGKLGEGRGVFSYYLEQALSGPSDYSKDGTIQINEIDLFVTNSVKEYTGGNQTPKFEVDDSSYPFSSIINFSNSESVLDLDKIVFNSRGLIGDISNHCSKHLEIFDDFSKTKDPSIDSLYHYYNKCQSCLTEKEEELKYSLESILISELHHIITNSLSGKVIFNAEDCQKGVRIIDSLFILHNESEVFYSQTLDDSRLFLETMQISLFEQNTGKDKLLKYKKDLLRRYREDDKSPLITISLAGIYSELSDTDSSIYYLQKSSKMSPTWLFPKYQLLVQYRKNQYETKAYELLDEVFEIDTLYRDYKCISCFFEEVNKVLWFEPNYKKKDKYYYQLLSKQLLNNEMGLIRFYKYLNAKEGLGYFKTLFEYYSLKKNLTNSFQDRMIYLTVEVHQVKTFLSDAKIKELIDLIDELILEDKFQAYIENGLIEKDVRITGNKLFQKIFPEDQHIEGYSFDDYAIFKENIEIKLSDYWGY